VVDPKDKCMHKYNHDAIDGGGRGKENDTE
jgi:hypothetical protein